MEENKLTRYESALRLARFKAERAAKSGRGIYLDEFDINEIMTVAGCPLIGESELGLINIKIEGR